MPLGVTMSWQPPHSAELCGSSASNMPENSAPCTGDSTGSRIGPRMILSLASLINALWSPSMSTALWQK
jgi:hypothetical protein